MSDGMAERRFGSALANIKPTTTPAPKSNLPVQSPEIGRLQRSTGELANALRAGTPMVPVHAINLRVALDAAVRVRGSITDRDRNLLAELEPRARALLAQLDAAPRDVAMPPDVTTTKRSETFDYQIDWGMITDVFDQMAPGMGPAVKLAPQRHRDALEAMTRSPLFAQQVFEEIWDDIKDHWFEIVQFTATMIAMEVGVAILVAVPEPTMGTKIAAFVLQALILAFAVHAAYEMGGAAIAYGTEFWSKVTAANGDMAVIDEAALAFVRLVFALFQTFAAAAGIGKAARFRALADIPPTPKPGSGNHGAKNSESKRTESTKRDDVEKKPPKESATPTSSLVEYRVERQQVRVETHRAKGGWSVDVKVPLPEGRRTHDVGIGHVKLDEHGAPVGGPSFTINKDASVGGVDGKVQIYQGTKKLSVTDVVLDESIAAFKKEFGHTPDTLPGGLAWENKLNFQRAYTRAVQHGMMHDAATQVAIREISFGRSRVARGYDRFLVDATEFADVDLGGSVGVRRVPTKIKVDARRSK